MGIRRSSSMLDTAKHDSTPSRFDAREWFCRCSRWRGKVLSASAVNAVHMPGLRSFEIRKA